MWQSSQGWKVMIPVVLLFETPLLSHCGRSDSSRLVAVVVSGRGTVCSRTFTDLNSESLSLGLQAISPARIAAARRRPDRPREAHHPNWFLWSSVCRDTDSRF